MVNELNVVVVVPIYKSNFSNNELISILQTRKILNKYDIVLVSPDKLRGSDFAERYQTVFFEDRYFENTITYSDFLLSDDFYRCFKNYEYMLICQLDAFVFSDKLAKWCEKGYDYIGAPLPAVGDFYAEIGSGVGNGGFSLRKIKSCIRVLQYKDKILRDHPVGWMMQQAEDLFFSYCGADSDIDFRTPDSKEAIQFSTQDDLYDVFSEHDRCLPFGTHAWDRLNYSHWKPYIESFGYKTDPPEREMTSEGAARNYAVKTFIQKYIDDLWYPDFTDRLKNWLGSTIGSDKIIAVRGAGKVGKRVTDLFDKAKVDYICVDRNPDGVRTIVPTDDFYREMYPVFIASTKYEREISDEVEKHGYVHGKDYITYDDLGEFICDSYPMVTEQLRRKYLHLAPTTPMML